MTTGTRLLLAVLTVGLLALGFPNAAHAYGGPGSVLSGIGTLLAALAALLASLFGFLWFPLKRLYRKIQGNQDAAAPAQVDSSDE